MAFWSGATNLGADDTNGKADVFLHDRQAGTTERVSVDSAGNQGAGDFFDQCGIFIVMASRYACRGDEPKSRSKSAIHGRNKYLIARPLRLPVQPTPRHPADLYKRGSPPEFHSKTRFLTAIVAHTVKGYAFIHASTPILPHPP